MPTRRRSTSSPTRDGQRAGRDISAITARVQGKIHKASEFPHNQKMLFYGKPGVGKTRLCATAPNVLLIDINDEGTDSVRRDLNPSAIRVYSWAETNDIYWYLQEGAHEYESVAIDGVTAWQTMCMNFVLGEQHALDTSRDPDMPSRQAWGKVGQLMKTAITNYRNLPMNVFFTATERARESSEGGDEEEIVLVYGPNCSPSISSHLEAAVGTIGRLVKREVVIKNKQKGTTRREVRRRLMVGDSERIISKDRNGLFGEYLDAPDIGKMLQLIYNSDSAD